jgi:hypothetical protein
MEMTKNTKTSAQKQTQKRTSSKILSNFFAESGSLVSATLKDMRHKYPELFKTS